MECWLISVNAMGGVKIGRMDAPYAGHSFLPCLALPSQTCIPKLGARDAFAAVKKCLFNFHDHCEIGHLTMIRHRVPNIPVTNNNSPAGNAKRFPLTRNKEDQPNAWILPQVLEKLKACPGAHVTINGYADNSGTEAINISLSTQRAQTVADFLLAHGVVVAQLVIKGMGSINPVAPNDTPEGRAKNRRVEIVVS